MDQWFINPVSGVQITMTGTGWLVAIPGRAILEYDFHEMEYIRI